MKRRAIPSRSGIDTVGNRSFSAYPTRAGLLDGVLPPAPMATLTRLTVDPRDKESLIWEGHWLAHSIDLHSELESLAPQVEHHIGPINRVMFLVDEWGAEAGTEMVNRRPVQMIGLWYAPREAITLAGNSRAMHISIRRPPCPIRRARRASGRFT